MQIAARKRTAPDVPRAAATSHVIGRSWILLSLTQNAAGSFSPPGATVADITETLCEDHPLQFAFPDAAYRQPRGSAGPRLEIRRRARVAALGVEVREEIDGLHPLRYRHRRRIGRLRTRAREPTTSDGYHEGGGYPTGPCLSGWGGGGQGGEGPPPRDVLEGGGGIRLFKSWTLVRLRGSGG